MLGGSTQTLWMVWIWSCVACPEYRGIEFVVQLDQLSGNLNGVGDMGMDLK